MVQSGMESAEKESVNIKYVMYVSAVPLTEVLSGGMAASSTPILPSALTPWPFLEIAGVPVDVMATASRIAACDRRNGG